MKRLAISYGEWLKENTTVREGDGWLEITTPFLDRHNDALQIYVCRRDGQFVLTDDGYILRDLAVSGFQLTSDKRRELLTQTLNGFGVRQSGDALEVIASETNFAARKHDLLQAMLAVNDLFYLAQPSHDSFFQEEVTEWLDSQEIRFARDMRLFGKSGLEHSIDYVIPKSVRQPERLLQGLSQPSRQMTRNSVFTLTDIRSARQNQTALYVMLNDQAPSGVPTDVLSAFEKYDITPILFSQRDNYAEELAA
ncbi:MAG: DUF1828 domain-containing protein [Fimbriimonadaceae bacterium]|nr:DUF1828 domain-containing protein [Fimbriimonadaceae bacterium]